MKIIWKPEHGGRDGAEKVTKFLENCKKISNGKITFDGNKFYYGNGIDGNEAILYSMLSFSESFPETEAMRIIWKALSISGEKGEINPETILSEINKLTADYLQLPLQEYVIVTTLSLSKNSSLPRVKLNKTIITFEPQVSEKYEKERLQLLDHAKHSLFGEIPNNYLFTKVKVSSRSTSEAIDIAFYDLDLTRGIWNLFYNRFHIWRDSSKRQPVNKIVIGPVHTIHLPSGKLADSSWGYEPNYHGAIDVLTPKADEMVIFYKDVRRRLLKCNYRHIIEESIIRYTRALDEHNWENAFLKLWGVLECLTNNGKENFDKTIERTKFIFEDRNYNLQVLRHLKAYRNQWVHMSRNNSNLETYIYQLKYFVENLIEFHLTNRFKFSSLEEATKFLDLPTSKDALTTRIKFAQNAYKYLGYK
jgi:hypothetical protein